MPGGPSQIHCWLWKAKHLNLSYDISKLESGTRSWYQLQVPRENVHSTNINSYVSDISNKVSSNWQLFEASHYTLIVAWGKKKSTFCYFVCTFPLERSEGFKKTESKVKRPFVVLEDWTWTSLRKLYLTPGYPWTNHYHFSWPIQLPARHPCSCFYCNISVTWPCTSPSCRAGDENKRVSGVADLQTPDDD